MKEKYLPIGTIVSKKGNNKKFMIIGYLPTIYTGKLTTYDYSAYPYPEGVLLKNQDGYFNHEEIEKIEFMGYEGSEYQQFISMLNDNNELVLDDSNSDDSTVDNYFRDIKFDENGFVVSVNDEKMENPFLSPVDIEGHKQPEENKDMSIFKNYQFDENGFVIGETEITEEKTNEEPVMPSTNNFEFDENGTVISERSSMLELKPANMPSYKFDENGTVIEDDTAINQEPEQLTSNLQFDENGFVISE